MYLRLGLHVQIRLYYVLPYKAKISAQHGIGFILERCIVYLGLTMSNLQKKRLLIFEIFNIKKCKLFFGTEYTIKVQKYTYKRSYTLFEINGILFLTGQKHKTCDKMRARLPFGRIVHKKFELILKQ